MQRPFRTIVTMYKCTYYFDVFIQTVAPDSDEEHDRERSTQVETKAEVYSEPKHGELETTKESEMTNQSGDSSEQAVKDEMEKVLESTTKEGTVVGLRPLKISV